VIDHLGYKLRSLKLFHDLNPKSKSLNFLGCDTYSALCEHRFDDELDFNCGIQDRESSLYSKASSAESLLRLIQESSKRGIPFAYKSLFLAEDDFGVSSECLQGLRSYFRVIYCVNLGSWQVNSQVRALPLGLESSRYGSAGRLSNFELIPIIAVDFRPISVLVAWNDKTHPKSRTSARKTLRGSSLVVEVCRRLPAQTIHRMMRRTLFTACPRGNGIDTHRFWESLYLGSIPIVLESEMSTAYERWPVLILKEWKELLKKSRKELEEIYKFMEPELISFRYNSEKFIEQAFQPLNRDY
jgi:hypothetical protein